MGNLLRAGLLSVHVLLSPLAMAGEVDVVDAQLVPIGGGQFKVNVTLRHGDEGWKHYADKWDLLSQDGQLLGNRVLYHPHVEEQPFTRSLTIAIPPEVQSVEVRGHDLVHGYGGKTLKLEVPQRDSR